MFISIWLVIGAGLCVLLVAAIKERNHKICKGYEIEIKGPSDKWFIDKKAISDLLSGNVSIKGKMIKQIELNKIEARLENNPWIKNAELFFGFLWRNIYDILINQTAEHFIYHTS